MTENGTVEDGLAAYARSRYGAPNILSIEPAGPVKGGLVARGLERLDVVATIDTGTTVSFSAIKKHTRPDELAALRAISQVRSVPRLSGDHSALPELLASGEDDDGVWVLMPLYEGSHPRREDIPPVVFETLAALHAHWLGRTDELPGILAITPDWWRSLCLDHLLPIVDKHRGDEQVYAQACVELEATADDPRIAAALDMLPRTLIHGDMHPGNIISGPDGTRIIDFGNARLGPPMLDPGIITPRRSANYNHYLACRSRLTGKPVDPWTEKVGWQWAQAQIETQYLGFVACARPASELALMLERRQAALEELGRLLEAGPKSG